MGKKGKKMVECDVKIGASDLYDYNLKYSFSKFINILSEIVGAFAVFYGIYAANYPLAFIGALVVIYLPVTLWLRSKAASFAFDKPLHYRLDDEGLTVSRGEESQTAPWDQCVKAVSTGRSILLFTSPVAATIFPRNQLGDKTSLVIQCISEHMPAEKVKIKW